MSWIEAGIWLIVIYLLPAIVACVRRSSWRSLCYFCTIFFGWTIVGWFVAWFLAFHGTDREPHRRVEPHQNW